MAEQSGSDPSATAGKVGSLDKDFYKLKADWNRAAKSDKYRDYIAQGYLDENKFRESGKICTDRLLQFLSLTEFQSMEKEL